MPAPDPLVHSQTPLPQRSLPRFQGRRRSSGINKIFGSWAGILDANCPVDDDLENRTRKPKNAEAELEDGNAAFGRCLKLEREILRTVLMLNHELFNGGEPWLGMTKENLDPIRLLLMDEVKELTNRRA